MDHLKTCYRQHLRHSKKKKKDPEERITHLNITESEAGMEPMDPGLMCLWASKLILLLNTKHLHLDWPCPLYIRACVLACVCVRACVKTPARKHQVLFYSFESLILEMEDKSALCWRGIFLLPLQFCHFYFEANFTRPEEKSSPGGGISSLGFPEPLVLSPTSVEVLCLLLLTQKDESHWCLVGSK